MSVRTDLLALDQQALEDLGNRGLFKRATRDVDGGDGQTITTADDGTVTATAGDVTTVLAPGVGLADTNCSCGAPGMCRHRIAAVLGYQADQASGGDDNGEAGSEPLVVWSPGDFTDDDLVARFSKTTISAARRRLRRGTVATITRPTDQDRVPTVELESCTVRFLVPHDLNYTSTSARAGTDDEFIVLAVWAFRQADEAGLTDDTATFDVGDGDGAEGVPASLDRALAFADTVLLEGATNLADHLLVSEPIQQVLETDGLRWPLEAFTDLQGQLDDYAERGALYSPATNADLLAELYARARGTAATDEIPRSRVLGSNVAAEASLRHVRLDGLGCRITGTPEDRLVSVYFAHADSAAIYVLRRRVTFDENNAPDHRRFLERVLTARATVRSLAHGNLVTSSAVRRANREFRVAKSGVSQSSVVPSAGAWEKLPTPLRVDDYDVVATSLRARAPRLVRARILAESLHAVRVAEVLDVGWRPGTQTLGAIVADEHENVARIELRYDGVAPGAVDALGAALTDPNLRFVSGFVRLVDEMLVIDPIGVATDRLIALDAVDPAQAEIQGLPVGRMPTAGGAHGEAIRTALDTLADVAHQGLRHLPTAYERRAEASSKALRAAGLIGSAEQLDDFISALGQFRSEGDPTEATHAWVDTRIRLLVAAEAAGAA